MKDRQEKLLRWVDKNGKGLEIGPSHRPMTPKSEGYDVEIVDYADQESLREHYRPHNVDIERIEPVDYVWKGQPLSNAVPKREAYDWIIASHVIEHLPDLIQFLKCCGTLLKPDGVLILAVPDCRYCFDHFRPLTGLASLIDAHYAGHTVHTAGTVAEYFMNVVSKGGKIAWNAMETGAYSFIHELGDAQRAIRTVRERGTYLDVHAWKFVPSSFRLIMADLRALDFIPLVEDKFYEGDSHEFFCTLRRGPARNDLARMGLAQTMAEEICLGFSSRYERFLTGHPFPKT